MGYWNFYFIIKLVLFFADVMDFHVLLNMVFAVFVLLPLKNRFINIARLVVAIPISISLFYYDTRFPPIERLILSAGEISEFSVPYLTELASRFLNPQLVLICAVVILLSLLAARKLRISTFVLLAMFPVVPMFHHYQQITSSVASSNAASTSSLNSALSGIEPVGFVGTPAPEVIDTALDDFFMDQKKQQVVINTAGPGPDFDILFLQVCSLAWDDLMLAGQSESDVTQRFDLNFTSFNAATSYSGPAAIRLLRSTCGQSAHDKLYDPVPSSCFLFNQLSQVGFETQVLLNHDGAYGNMLKMIQQYGGLTVDPESLSEVPTQGVSFDGTPIWDDYAVLSNWFKGRQASSSERIALYYNSISLHDGNHASVKNQEQESSSALYVDRVKQFLTDIDLLLTEFEESGRNIVVVMVPEHGAGAKGDRMQLPFMRENPSPSITQVPVGIRFIGTPRLSKPINITQSTSYNDLAGLIRDVVITNPYVEGGQSLDALAESVGTTPLVSENDGSVVVKFGSNYYIKYRGGNWKKYDYRRL